MILRPARPSLFLFLASLFATMVTEAAEPAPVAVAQPEITNESMSHRFTGTVSVRRLALLSPRLPGLIQIADIEVGDSAEKGDTLVQLDPTLAEIDLELREADLSLAKAELEDSQRLVDEAKQLGDTGIPRSERLSRETDLEIAKVRFERSKAEVKAQQERLNRHKVVAPFSGKVARKLTEIGEWVETGDPVIELVGDADYRLEVRVPQEKIQEVIDSQQVTIQLPGLASEELIGHVEALGPVVDSGTRTFLVRVPIDNPPNLLKPGMSAVATFKPKSDDSVLLIPRDAIIRTGEGETLVWVVVEKDGNLQAQRRPVELGAPRGSKMIVLGGLAENDTIVVRGNESLRQDQSVRIVEAASNDNSST